MDAMMNMTGQRLAFVAVPLKGKVTRTVHKFVRGKGIIPTDREQPAGYMVYFPRGHALRMSAEQLRQYQLDQEPEIINLKGIANPNSPMGKLMRAQDDKARRGVMISMEKQVMQLATRYTGPILLPEQAAAMRRLDEEAEAA